MRKTHPLSRTPMTAAVHARLPICVRVCVLICVLTGLLAAGQCEAKPPAPPIVDGVSLDVQDGDSFVMRDDLGNRIRVRLSGIDAPEKSQPYADRSRQHLRELMRATRIRLEPVKLDVFGRTVARVWILSDDGKTGRDAGLAQIEAGLAWHFKRYKSDQPGQDAARYAQAERLAQTEHLGLWRDPAPEPPWEFRTRMKHGDQGSTPRTRPGAN